MLKPSFCILLLHIIISYENIDKVQNRASRFFTGVHKYAPILGHVGDMGWTSNRGRWKINILRLWNRLRIPAIHDVRTDISHFGSNLRILPIDRNCHVRHSWKAKGVLITMQMVF